MKRKLTLQEIVEQFQVARIVLAARYPYLSHILFAVKFNDSSALDRNDALAVVDKNWVVHFSVDATNNILKATESVHRYADSLMGVLFAYVLLHEILHLLLEHIERGEDKIAHAWQVAADFEVNSSAIDMLPMARGLVYDFSYFPDKFGFPTHMPAEWYYERLLDKVVLSAPNPALDALGVDGAGIGAGAGDDNADELTKISARMQTAKAIIEHMKSAGTVPAGLARWAKRTMQPKVKWHTVLRKWVQREFGFERARVGDFTYKVPSKKTNWAARPPSILPSVTTQQLRVAVIVDTSASMSEDELGQAVAEVRAICRALGCPVHIIACDADVQRVERVWGARTSTEHLEKLLIGGGGTVLVKGMQKAQNDLKAKLIIALTDGHSIWDGAEQITVPTVVVCVGKGAAARHTIPSHFHVIYTDDDGGDAQ